LNVYFALNFVETLYLLQNFKVSFKRSAVKPTATFVRHDARLR